MSQADYLLNTLAVDETVVEEHIVIGRDRIINVPASLRRIAVQYDHNIETITFDCPRYWDNHDLSTMQIYINYVLPDGTPGSYVAENISVDDNMFHFTWTITNQITQNKGGLAFLVCAKRTDDEGFQVLHWNTEINRDTYIAEGLETAETSMSRYPDIITQLLSRISALEETVANSLGGE